MALKPIIIPVASGKGGVGKSFLTANLAMSLAAMGHRTLAVDLDLGGANLHGFLGLPNRYPGIGDFLKAKRGELADLRVPTPFENLEFLPGDGKTPFMANISYTQKRKLIPRLRRLPAEYILLDLGAGTTFNTLDFFNLSPLGILVTVPEHHAVMNMLAFLKNFLLRVIERSVGRNHAIRNMLRDAMKQPLEDQTSSISQLVAVISKEDPEAGKKITAACRRYRPRMVFNEGEHPDDLNFSAQITQSLRQILSLEADYFGFVFFDSAVRKAVRSQTPFLPNFPQSPAALAIGRIAERIVKYWQTPIPDSAALLMDRVRKDFAPTSKSRKKKQVSTGRSGGLR
ncbi:MAG: P-loop NTPase [Desulfobacterales bacterium]|nr:P-loop NTPase [Desulfobacterales bacterium]